MQCSALRSVNVLASVQEARQKALVSLRALIAIMARSTPHAQPPALPNSAALAVLSILQHLVNHHQSYSTQLTAQSQATHIPALHLGAFDLEATHNIGQVWLVETQ